jgi:hypothetical protein
VVASRAIRRGADFPLLLELRAELVRTHGELGMSLEPRGRIVVGGCDGLQRTEFLRWITVAGEAPFHATVIGSRNTVDACHIAMAFGTAYATRDMRLVTEIDMARQTVHLNPTNRTSRIGRVRRQACLSDLLQKRAIRQDVLVAHEAG